MKNEKFIDSLVEKGILALKDRKELEEKTGDDHFRLLHILKDSGVVSKSFLGRLWGDSIGVAYVDLMKTIFQPQALKFISREFAVRHNIIPIYKLGKALTIVTSFPDDTEKLNDISAVVGGKISPVFSFPEDIEDAISIQYQSREGVEKLLNKVCNNSLFQVSSKISEGQLRKFSGEKAVIDFTDGIIFLGVKERATDIHIDPFDGYVKVRFRIDGVLQNRLRFDSAILLPLSSRLKVLASLDITEKRRPQDGRITLKLKNRSVDIRFSSVPSVYGEKIVLRILGQLSSVEIPGIEELDLSNKTYKKVEKIVNSPNGIFLVTGPTGSGKTTTLFSILKRLNSDDVNILTVEDPVEYKLEGINQVQVNNSIKLSFASALRAFLRQDPDIILVGEIRDPETGRIATQAALTGHLVLATLHSNNAIQATTRLVDIGVAPYIVSPALIGVMSQRLVRKICENCKTGYTLTKEEAEEYFILEGDAEVEFFRGKGCSRCNFTGYSGRLGIHEIFLIDNEIRDIIALGGSIVEIEKAAVKKGFKNIYYDAIKKVLRGFTTIDELERVLGKG